MKVGSAGHRYWKGDRYLNLQQINAPQPSELIPCNLCGNCDVKVIFRPGVAQVHQIVQCNKCGLMYANPRALEHEHFDEDPADELPTSDPHIIQRLQKERIQVTDYRNSIALLSKMHPVRGRLLEIGSAFGFLLAELRRHGWDVMGIDPYAAACNYARQENGLEVVNGTLESVGIADGAFDVVIMNHVIEHLPDPLRTLREIRRVLKPGGHLVLETPRYDSVMFKLLGRRERSISCDGHIYFFTSKSLRDLCEAAGFGMVQLDYVGRTLTLDRLFWNVGVVSKLAAIQSAIGRISRALHFERIHIHLNLRDMQRVCLRRD